MKLFYSATSPYTRKVLVTAIEKGFCGKLQLRACDPHAAEPELVAVNPMSRIPTLLLDDDTALFDSPVICEWLDNNGENPRLVPVAGPERWAVLRGQALADGMMDDAYANVMESRRPANLQSQEVMAARAASLLRCTAALEQDLPALPGTLTLGHIAAACALAYLDFRLPQLDWRRGNPNLSAWFHDFSRRSAMTATRPDAETT